MSYRELNLWYSFYNKEPFLSDKIEVQLATISTLIAGFGGSKLKHNDFMISHKVQKQMTKKEKQDAVKAQFKMLRQ